MTKKIMVVDDEADIQTVLRKILISKDYDVVVAHNGADALEVLKKEKVDLILMDVLMPVMDGFGCFKLLKKESAYAKIPVIVFTARGGMRDTFEVMGADDFVPKPFEIEDLVARVKGIFQNTALILSQDYAMNEAISSALGKLGYETEIVSDFNEMQLRGRTGIYKTVVMHLGLLPLASKEVMASCRSFKNKSARVVVYSDSSVKGMEKSYANDIEKLRKEWLNSGVNLFFDSRVAEKIFSDALLEVVR